MHRWQRLSNGEIVTQVKIRNEQGGCVVFFNRLAEIAGEYSKKGSKVYVEGELRTRDWERDGQKHYTTEIVVNEMQMLDFVVKWAVAALAVDQLLRWAF